VNSPFLQLPPSSRSEVRLGRSISNPDFGLNNLQPPGDHPGSQTISDIRPHYPSPNLNSNRNFFSPPESEKPRDDVSSIPDSDMNIASLVQHHQRSVSEDHRGVISQATHLPGISHVLLSSIPYATRLSVHSYTGSEGSLLIRPGQSSWASDIPAEQEATESVRALLQEWTDASPSIIAALLDEDDKSSSRSRYVVS
jgi:hypothetical protein